MGKWAIAIHGGAGVDPNLPVEVQEAAKRLLERCLRLGVSALRSNAAAIDVVERIVRELEDDPVFNAGRGSALTNEGTVEMDASIMDGSGRRYGAVSGLSTVKNPVSLARLVMDKTPHSYLAFAGAEKFARDQGVQLEDESYFIVEDRVKVLKFAKKINATLFGYPEIDSATLEPKGDVPFRMNGQPLFGCYRPETVGCVVVDKRGMCAAATSTGGITNKMVGRIGDSPIIGAGIYACKLCGVSCTGEGEFILRATLAREVAAAMEYKGLSLKGAVEYAINERLDEGQAGLIAVSNEGEVAYGFNSVGMFRGFATEDGNMEIGIWDKMFKV
ncbi:hypothetical protein Nepgr_025089 [Nepenthes gracilis]|uniref:beta-aspartyl-peptidase n=1 Tax=Nepenthes gracilis TaxID=150966 RepID=A0AAD3T614_NEPGR|nr:hypothetical protein Nepgr_025089 [Nepenthes gracilis]